MSTIRSETTRDRKVLWSCFILIDGHRVPKDPVYLFEIKVRKKFNQMDDGLEEAYRQIKDRKYEEGILDDGYAGVVSFGICFCRKSCIVGLYKNK